MNSQQMMEAFVNWANDQGLETRERIAAQAAWMAATDRLSLLCEVKDAAIQLAIDSANIQEVAHFQQLSEAQTQIAMQAEALNKIKWHRKPGGSPTKYEYEVEVIAHNALAATSETVAAWRAKETEPLRREVAMWYDIARGLSFGVDWNEGTHAKIYRPKLIRAVQDTQASALAYEQEVENRGAVKALEEAANHFSGAMFPIKNELLFMAEERRAANKGEVK